MPIELNQRQKKLRDEIEALLLLASMPDNEIAVVAIDASVRFSIICAGLEVGEWHKTLDASIESASEEAVLGRGF